MLSNCEQSLYHDCPDTHARGVNDIRLKAAPIVAEVIHNWGRYKNKAGEGK